MKEIEQFKPNLILLGDDNAANYVGNQYIDTNIPVVFWGINGLPLKYGLLDSLEKPGQFSHGHAVPNRHGEIPRESEK